MNISQNYQNWQVETDQDDILWLILNRKDSAINSLNRPVLEEFMQLLNEITQIKPRGVIICSGKASGFIAGADIEQFRQIKDVNEAVELVREGQKVFDKLASLPIPTVAMIEGFCLGGGLELALACQYRIAEESISTRLGLPEVKLGIHPGWGGTIRLPLLIGALQAMDLILSGRTVAAKSAQKMGLVDAAVPKRQLKKAARYQILNQVPVHKPTKLQALTNIQPFRYILAEVFRRKVEKKANPKHYPAPFAVIDNWLQDGASGNVAMINEASSIGRLLVSDTSRNLVHVFFLQEQLKNLAKEEKFSPQHVHVIGAGLMGGDIAAWCALRGLRVTLQDREPQFIAPAIKRAYALFKKKLKTPRQIQAVMDRLIPDTAGSGVAQADVIIEAIFENLEAKQQLFKEVEAKAKPDAILATNTSSIPLDEINSALINPQRLVGIHFFNPVSMMPLVEVVRGNKTLTPVMNKAISFVRSIDRLPLPVKSSPGFLVNRILSPYLIECVTLADEGVSATAIDKTAIAFGMPMGPVELADAVGLDVCLSVAKSLGKHFDFTIPEVLVNKVEQGELGRKTGKGFYEYKNGKPVKEKLPKSYTASEDLSNRLILRMINEAAACLREGVIDNADLLDAGMIFGTGFAPYTGGPMHYAEHIGIDVLVEKLTKLQQHYGERFKPDAYWQQINTKQESKERALVEK